MKRHATAVWKGTGKDGKGNLTTQSKALSTNLYSADARFGDGVGTNPEELIAAAHAGCFTMKLAFILADAGFDPQILETKCVVEIKDGTVTSSNLTLNATVDGVEQDKFEEFVENALKNCPISKLLKTEISVDATLN